MIVSVTKKIALLAQVSLVHCLVAVPVIQLCIKTIIACLISLVPFLRFLKIILCAFVIFIIKDISNYKSIVITKFMLLHLKD